MSRRKNVTVNLNELSADDREKIEKLIEAKKKAQKAKEAEKKCQKEADKVFNDYFRKNRDEILSLSAEEQLSINVGYNLIKYAREQMNMQATKGEDIVKFWIAVARNHGYGRNG